MILVLLGAAPLIAGWLWLLLNGDEFDRGMALYIASVLGVIACLVVIIMGITSVITSQ